MIQVTLYKCTYTKHCSCLVVHFTRTLYMVLLQIEYRSTAPYIHKLKCIVLLIQLCMQRGRRAPGFPVKLRMSSILQSASELTLSLVSPPRMIELRIESISSVLSSSVIHHALSLLLYICSLSSLHFAQYPFSSTSLLALLSLSTSVS